MRLEEKCTPGETPEPINTCGLAGARPLGLGVAVLPPLPPTITEQRNISTGSPTFLPSTVLAANKRIPTVPTVPPPRPPRQLDQEVSVIFLLEMLAKKLFEHQCTRGVTCMICIAAECVEGI